MLEVGTKAPDFTLHTIPGKQLTLSDFRGKRVILAFYPADWSPECSEQLTLYNELLQYFGKLNAQVIGLSVDSKWCHKAFVESCKLGFPLVSDFEPRGAVAKAYDVYDEAVGECRRALYVIDEEGLIRWNYLSPPDVNPGAHGIINVLEEMDKAAA